VAGAKRRANAAAPVNDPDADLAAAVQITGAEHGTERG